MKKVFIIGASGFLGTKLFNTLSSMYKVKGSYSSHPRANLVQLDVTKKDQVKKVLSDFKPDIVVHTVAYADPDVCEQYPEKAEEIIHGGTKNIAEVCGEIGAVLHYVSTVYVFDGKKGLYTEEDTPHPINTYGQAKLRAEEEVKKLPKYVIYRFDKLYGYNGKNQPNDMLSKILSDQPYVCNEEQKRQPLLIDDIGEAIKIIDRKGLSGIFHLAGPETITKYHLARQLAALVGKEDSVIPITQEKQIAKRPLDASLVANKATSFGISFTPLAKGLELIKLQLAAN